MRLTVLGSTAGCPGRENPASGYLLEADGATIWLDAGTGTFMELARRVDPGRLDAVVLSHGHVDHCVDVLGLYGYLAFGPSGHVPVPVLLPAGVTEQLTGFARAGEEHVLHHVLALETVAPGDVRRIGAATLTFGRAEHPVPTLTVRVDHPGGSLAYSADTGPGGDLADLARDTDLLLCEATLQGPRDPRTYPYHLTAAEAGGVARDAAAGRLVLTHVAALLDPEVSVAEAAAVFAGPVAWAAPGSAFATEEYP